ncbi:MAG: type I-E CRISPR-associated protein Cas6/Cse3/CasE [Schaalia hyovaginalis]|uniref:type I-E CRISPR-associated protein Cas6/Cse3/CasE n=2 Tax=Schaalia hyovaginalis TaxID=29316 RepID=UPI002A74A130|nr:type I-E CRISPR-associated protein Cas6/Cse3/CasE [Schaalia hyovaginalis]MDY3093243.1 type I-E CRISPR-associated protein Cas6/Cse3/CasE [Schaalia hyovaginalis]
MYLTRIFLNPYRRGCKRLVSSPQKMHAAVLASFPPGVLDGARGPGRVLWRLDTPSFPPQSTREGSGGPFRESPALSLYISSPVPPDPAGLIEQAGYETEGGVLIKRMDPFLDSLREGQTWAFRVTVNPTFRKAGQVAENGRKKVLAHITVAQQTRWLLDRVPSLGFEILTAAEIGGDLPVMETETGERRDGDALLISLANRRTERFRRGVGEDARIVTLQLATFEGHLRIVNPVLLRNSMTNGIGRAKGYGSGLLTLAKP